MRSFLLLGLLFFFYSSITVAQETCATKTYEQQEFNRNPSIKKHIETRLNNLLLTELRSESAGNEGAGTIPIIRIPVVVHVVYNTPEQNISEEQIHSQIAVLNEAFRLRNADTVNIPAAFRSLAADCRIEFSLATINPRGYFTNGIVRVKTSMYSFGTDDKIKFKSAGGDDAWDSDRYLNIWVANLTTAIIGYSSIVGGIKEKDGIVVRFDAFGNKGLLKTPYTKGHTTIHEVGHWLGLKHIWGDHWCGDDGVEDTPAQPGATRGCPGSFVKTCNNQPSGAMFNNYMDISYDECTNMFTFGQRDKMRESFLPNSPRHTILFSNGATAIGIPGPEPIPDNQVEQQIKIYPNPSSEVLIIDISKNKELIGQDLILCNQLGQKMMQTKINNSKLSVNVSTLLQGIYFVRIGSKSKPIKFVKMNGNIE